METEYTYSAYTQDGKLTRGRLDAATEQDVFLALERRGLVPLNIDIAAEELKPWWKRDIRFGRAQISAQSTANLAGVLRTLIEAGVSLKDALGLAAEALNDKALRSRLLAARDRIERGGSAADAFGRGTTSFPPEFTSYVILGDETNRLSKVLQAAEDLFRARAEARSKVAAALVYPAILILAAIGLFGVLVFFLAPTLSPIFASAGVQPNATLRALFWVYETTTVSVLVIGATCLVGLLVLLSALPRHLWAGPLGRLAQRLPVFGTLITSTAWGQIARGLSLLTGAGVPLQEALARASEYAPATPAKVLLAARDTIEAGDVVTDALDPRTVPPAFRQMAEIAHRANSWESTMASAARLLEADATRARDRLLQILTPALTLLIGVMMGTVMLSIVTALLEINNLVLQ